jgi:hypothetical protein
MISERKKTVTTEDPGLAYALNVAMWEQSIVYVQELGMDTPARVVSGSSQYELGAVSWTFTVEAAANEVET